jgi:hypothetical protein
VRGHENIIKILLLCCMERCSFQNVLLRNGVSRNFQPDGEIGHLAEAQASR